MFDELYRPTDKALTLYFGEKLDCLQSTWGNKTNCFQSTWGNKTVKSEYVLLWNIDFCPQFKVYMSVN